MNDDMCQIFHRKAARYKDFQRFNLSSKTFNRQYASIYIARLAALKNDIVRQAKYKWGKYKIVKLSDDLEAINDEHYIIIGTIYKHQELKPSILHELSQELQLVPQPAKSHYASNKDFLFLEDEELRIKLVSNHMNVKEMVTGLVCAVLGHQQSNNTFWVEDWCYPACCPKSSTLGVFPKNAGKLLIVSGLDFAHNASMSLNLLSEWICGMIGFHDAQKEEAAVAHIIIAGNSVKAALETFDPQCYSKRKTHNQHESDEIVSSIHRFDEFLENIVRSCPVTLMPGEFDPTGHMLPQQPLHSCILPRSSRFRSLHGATNPWIGSIDSRVVAGSSGQPITDITKVTGLKKLTHLTWLERTLYWRHFAPTAPDTLPAYPYFENDPFVIPECPDIYFAGNMEKYDTELLNVDDEHVVRIICVPKFSETKTAVLVDLQDLNTWPISFHTD